MNFQLSQYRLSGFRTQRNGIAAICAVLLLINGIQSLCLFGRHERIIITPPQLTQGFWVEGNQFSPQYLEEMALHYSHFMLDVTEKNILYQGEILLRYVVPEAYGVFHAKLLEDEKRLKRNNLSTRFYAVESKVLTDGLSVEITGDLMSYVGDKRISSVRETYQMQFQNQSGKLLIKGFSLVKTESKADVQKDEV